ncbi:MAG: iron-containing alcohol dehydrogenase [Dehalococcoidia bacterium]|nr:iron-containing alcohol dehydrogenase [Dehalococcoidia bacterium]
MAARMTQVAPVMFGVGALASLGDQLKMLESKKAIIITDKGVTGAGITSKVESVVKEAGVQCAVYDDCLSDAPTDTIPLVAGAVRAAGADAIIALGGGSSIDTAKAASLIIKNDRPITPDITAPDKPPAPDVPIITIPTTSGTGSEVTIVGVVSDSKTSQKYGVFISGATLAIVDPELTIGVPPHLTAMTGMDTISHAIEAVTGVQRNPMSDLKGFEALRLANAHLFDAVRDGKNIVAREGMSLASCFAGMAFNDSVTSLSHAISQAIAKSLHLHHGLICGLATPVQLELYATAIPARIRKIGEIFGADIPYDATREQIGRIAADRIREFMSSIGIQSFEQLGFSRKDVTKQTDALMEEFMIQFAPIEITREVAEAALDRMCDYCGAD